MINTREIAKELRLSHWARIIREQQESGLSKQAFCKQIGVCHNTYFYWQRKLREAACEGLMNAAQPETVAANIPTMPHGWVICEPALDSAPKEKPLPIEIGGCRVLASADTDPELLAQVCKVLVSLC